MTAKKKTYVPKVEGYVPEAIDADGDGLVQDGTEFERPVETELPEFVEVIETHVVAEGENVLTIAEKYKPEGMTRRAYAAVLYAKNGDLHEGKTIRL